ncbi:MAG: DUF1189 domain-containing protein [Candidatus Taylorbacteria bacterium]|nr:DUF1189 domain-containing protein [Candidatus Taylorbacteria bacterium]
MHFFETVKESLYSPSLYASLPKRPLGASVKYFFLLSLLCTAVLLLVDGNKVMTDVAAFRDSFITKLVSAYPEDLEITVKNGAITSNKQGEFKIPFPVAENTVEKPERAYLVVINTDEKFTLEKWEKANTQIWVGNDLVAWVDSKGFKMGPASELPEGTLNQALIDKYYKMLLPFLAWLPAAALVGVGVVFFFNFILHFFWAFVLAVLVLIIAHNLKKKFSYGDAYKATLHAMTIGFLLSILEQFGVPHAPFVFSVLALVVAYASLSGTPAEHIPAAVS